MPPPEPSSFFKDVGASYRKMAADFFRYSRQQSNVRTLIILVCAGAVSILVYAFAIRPPDQFPTAQLVSLPEGTSLSGTAHMLKDDGVIRSTIAFRIAVSVLGAARTLHAGDYVFDEPLGVVSIARAIATGAFGLEPARVRIPEGATAQEISVILQSSLLRFSGAAFLAEAKPYEGYLFPDTYEFLPNASEDTVLQALRQNFDAQVAPLQPQIASSTHSLSDIIIMASILEDEANNTTDRRLIAGILWGRITRGMPLQVDSPFAYSIGKSTFELTKADLATNSPYNTYINKGLPPTPIGNPSLDSIEAALDPTPSNYVYYLADKNGVTHYCTTYSCQLANKAKYF